MTMLEQYNRRELDRLLRETEPPPCSGEEGCPNKVHRRGMCQRHYQKWCVAHRGEGNGSNKACREDGCTEVTTIKLDDHWWCDDHCPVRGWDLIRLLDGGKSWAPR